MQTQIYAAVMFCAGIGIPVLAALNAALGQRLGSPAAAAVILFCVALCVALGAAGATGPRAVLRAAGAPPHLFLAGVLIAFYVLSVTAIAPRFGVGNAVFFVLIGQLASAALIDQFGLFGAPVRPVSLMRGAGIALMAAGVVLTQRA
ncbi:DMT family transporter [Tropicimonas marinistellae]|uniref:DMT family transporter n=1 Tax=Tropicimonas marinistellae TaxID=1739787 RepID=UPI0008345478|nr:DMT family transporter [Tropicimonas marinistellae]